MAKDLRRYYKALGLPIGASREMIKKTYRRLAVQHHPDLNPQDKTSTEKFLEIKEAYEELIELDPARAQATAADFGSPAPSSTHADKTKPGIFRYKPKVNLRAYDGRETGFPAKPLSKEFREKPGYFLKPTNLGVLLFGSSTLAEGYKPFTVEERMKRGAWAILALFMGSCWLAASLEMTEWYLLLPTGTLAGLGLAWLTTAKHKARNYFVGHEGFAVFQIHLTPENRSIEKENALFFADVTELLLEKDWVPSGRSQVPAWRYYWICGNKIGAQCVAIIPNQNEQELRTMDYWFQRRAEQVWTLELLSRLESEIHEKGHITFYEFTTLGSGRAGVSFQRTPAVRLSPGKIRFLRSDTELSRADLRRWALREDDLVFETTAQARYDLPFRQLGNLTFFFECLEILLGITLHGWRGE